MSDRNSNVGRIFRITKQEVVDKTTRNEATGCWEWNGCKIKGGYGTRSFYGGQVNGKRTNVTLLAHRLAYEAYTRPVVGR